MKLVKENLESDDDVIVSCGLVIIQDNKILLCHPTGSRWQHTYSIPKGHIEDNETSLECAIRETEEETGLKMSVLNIDFDEQETINYHDKNGEIYKKIHYFVVRPTEEIILDKNKLQSEEIDWANFLTKEEAEERIFPKLKEV